MGMNIFIRGLLSCFLSLMPWALAHAVGIWDGEYTDAKSGVEGELYDPGRTDGQSGLNAEDAPKSFHLPPPRRWDEADLDEPGDYEDKPYSPYARLRLRHVLDAMTVAGKPIHLIPGYYLVKPVSFLPGNLPIKERLIAPRGENAETSSWQSSSEYQASLSPLPQMQESQPLTGISQSMNLPPLGAGNSPSAAPSNQKPDQKNAKNAMPRYLMIKQTGKVFAIIPLGRVSANTAPKKQRPRTPQVEVIPHPAGGMLLRYADKRWVADTSL